MYILCQIYFFTETVDYKTMHPTLQTNQEHQDINRIIERTTEGACTTSGGQAVPGIRHSLREETSPRYNLYAIFLVICKS